MTRRDGLGECVDFLVTNFLVDVGREQTSCELRILRLLNDECGGGLDGESIKFPCRRTVVEPADGLRRDPERVDAGETDTTAIDGTHDLGDVDRLRRAVALFHSHGLLRIRIVCRDILRRAGF